MKNTRTLTPIFGLLATAVYAFAQTPPAPPRPAAAPRPMTAPTPMAAPEPMPAMAPFAPTAPDAPLPPMAYISDLDEQMVAARAMVLSPEMQDKIQEAREMAQRAREDMRYQVNINNDVRLEIENQM